MDWIEFPFEVWGRVHRGPGAPLVRLRWMYTDQPFLPLDTQCVINDRIWNEDQVSTLAVGQLIPEEAEYDQDARWTLPPLSYTGHMCHPEWLAVGEPWPIPPSLPPTVYSQGWIPECCVMCCSFVGCSLDPINALPASQERQYAIPAKDATADTPCLESQVGDGLGGAGPDVRGAEWAYRPLGSAGPRPYIQGAYADAAGTLLRVTRDADFGSGDTSSELIDPDGWTYALSVGGVSTTLTLRVTAGVGEICGTNLRLCAALLPAGVTPRATAGYLALAGGQAGAAAIATTGAQVVAINTAHGVRLPSLSAAGNRQLSVVHITSSPVASCLLYPASGDSIAGLGVNNPYTLTRGTGAILVEACGPTGNWALIPY